MFDALKRDWTDISSEKWRAYRMWIDGVEVIETIDNPLKLHVSASGGHRILDAEGISYYIPPKWSRITWEPNENEPHFVK